MGPACKTLEGTSVVETAVVDRHVLANVARYAALAAVMAGVYLTSLYSYNLFHGIVELFSVVVEAAVFVIAWNARRYFTNNYVLALGLALGYVALVELLHTLAYAGMNVFPGQTADLPTQLWLVARYLQAAALVAAPLVMNRRFHAGWYLFGFGLAWAGLLTMVFTGVFPTAFVPETGLTTFKIVSEYVICVFLLVALGLLVWRRAAFEPYVFRRLAGAIVLTIAAEVLFTFYSTPTGASNMAGHLLKVWAFYLIYRAVVETALRQPYSLLFRELKQSEEALRQREEAQRHIADVLQEALLIMPESVPGITFGRLYRPAAEAARVGGDFCDLFVLPKSAVGLLIGDVSGHGLEAATLTAVAKNTIEAFAFDDQSPAGAMQKANLVTIRSTARSQGELTFITAFYGVLDTITGHLRFTSAGHPPGIVRRASGETFILEGSSPVLGVFPDAKYTESEEVLAPGDLLLLYTDGVSDVRCSAQRPDRAAGRGAPAGDRGFSRRHQGGGSARGYLQAGD